MYLVERACRARAENSEVCDGIEFFCTKKERENLLLGARKKKIDRQSGFSI